MEIEYVKEHGKCCITGKPLRDSKYVNMVQLDYKATWEYPVWGNVLTGATNMAVAYIHDEAIDCGGKLMGPVLYAVEFGEAEIIYHDVNTLVHDDL